MRLGATPYQGNASMNHPGEALPQRPFPCGSRLAAKKVAEEYQPLSNARSHAEPPPSVSSRDASVMSHVVSPPGGSQSVRAHASGAGGAFGVGGRFGNVVEIE